MEASLLVALFWSSKREDSVTVLKLAKTDMSFLIDSRDWAISASDDIASGRVAGVDMV